MERPIKKINLKYVSVALVFIHIILVSILNAFPFQDLPQHLAYAKIFKDFENIPIFSEFYRYSGHFNSYHLPYYLLKIFQYLFSTIVSFKILFLLYGLFIYRSIKSLRTTLYEDRSNYIPMILAVILSWNSVFFMGFLQYSLTLPFIIFGFNHLYRFIKYKRTNDLYKYFTYLILVSCIHVFATGTLFVFATIYLLIHRFKKLAVFNTIFSLLSLLIFGGFLARSAKKTSFFSGNIFDGAFGFEFINHIFNLKWSNLPTIANYLAWNILSPVPLGMLTIGVIFTIIFLIKKQVSFFESNSNSDKYLSVFFKYLFLFSILLPWALYKPTEITFINYRFTGMVVALFLATLSRDHFTYISKNHLLPLVLGFKFLATIYILVNFQLTTNGLFKVINSIPKEKVVHTVVYENRTDYTAKMFRIQHFLPMYYTVLRDGVSTQFWAGYTSHLPIKYNPNKKPQTAPDWHPKNTTVEDIQRFDYHLIREPSDLNSGYFEIRNELNDNFKVLAKYKDWTAYGRK